MHKKISKILILIILLVFLAGLTSAANTNNTDTKHIIKETQNSETNQAEIQEKIVEKKTIKKENNTKNVKKTGQTIDVSDFNTLHDSLTSNTYDTVTLNIKSDITLTDNTVLNKEIKTLTINGNNKIINGNNKYQFLYNTGCYVVINNLKIMNCGDEEENGGVIYNKGTLEIYDSTLTQNKGYLGSAIYNTGTLTITNSKITNNEGAGSTIHNSGRSTVKNSFFFNNTDGAIYSDGTLTVSDSNFTNNYGTSGGAIDTSFDMDGYAYIRGKTTITNSKFINNRAKEIGGAIYNVGYVRDEGNTYENNTSKWGGALYQDWGGSTTIIGSYYKNNSAIENGGAIYSKGDYDDLIIKNSIFTENKAQYGSAINILGNTLSIDNTEFKNNNATQSTYTINSYKFETNMDTYSTYFDISNSRFYRSENTNKEKEIKIAGFSTIKNTTFTSTKTFLDLEYSDDTPTINNSITIKTTLTNYYHEKIANQKINLTIDGKKYSLTTNSDGIIKQAYTPTTNGIKTVTVEYAGNNIYDSSKTTDTINVYKLKTKITINASKYNSIAADKITITGKLTDINNKILSNKTVSLTIDYDKKHDLKTNKEGIVTFTYIPESTGEKSLEINFNGDNFYNSSSADTTIIIVKSNVTIKLNPIKGIIGETITLQATLTDTNNNKVNGGNLAFKLNGKTLRSDGRFDSKAGAMKFTVKNGLVTYTIKADLYLRNAKNLTASYSGSNNYYESTSPSVTAQIQKRNAQVTVTTTPSKAKQYETLTFKITAKDTTKNGKNTTLISDNTKVMLKVNGVTLKDKTGKTIYVALDKNAQATYKYTIPAGTGGITASKAARNYKVDAIFVGDNYYPGARNTTSFQVERSPTTVTITQAQVTKTNVLSVKATLKDYKGNNLIGTNKVTIKINGKNYVDSKNGKAKYWSVKNGIVDLTGIQVDPKTTIKRVMLVTGERQAYTEGRAETTTIIRT